MRFILDENFNNNILRGVLRDYPDLDFIRAQDIPELKGQHDPVLLAWAAEQERILLTHDVRTITRYAYERIAAGEALPGVIEIRLTANMGKVIEDILTFLIAGNPADVENKVIYIPM